MSKGSMELPNITSERQRKMKRSTICAALYSMMVLLVLSITVEAATIRVRCEKRSNRSKISIDGKDLARRNYKARVISGSNTVTSDPQAAVGDEVEFDFDSDPDDIADGATPIAPNFIQSGKVTGKILNPAGYTVISDTVSCRVRN